MSYRGVPRTSIKVEKGKGTTGTSTYIASASPKSTTPIPPASTGHVGYLEMQKKDRAVNGKSSTTTGGYGSQGSYGSYPKSTFKTYIPKAVPATVPAKVEEVPQELEDSRFDTSENLSVVRSSAVLGLTKGCSVLSRKHTVAFDILCYAGKGKDITVGKSDGTVTVHKTANYKMTLTGFAKSKKDITVQFYYPETRPDLVTLATTRVLSMQDVCLLNGISTTLSLREGETVQLRVMSEENFTIGDGLRWEINEC